MTTYHSYVHLELEPGYHSVCSLFREDRFSGYGHCDLGQFPNFVPWFRGIRSLLEILHLVQVSGAIQGLEVKLQTDIRVSTKSGPG